MQKSNQIGAIILGAAAALAIYKYTQMTKEERDDFFSTIKDKTQELLEDADNTVEKVQHYVAQIKEKQPNEWFDKLYLVRKMFNEFYGITPKSRTQGLPSMS
jgi:oligoendopeptidase F